MDDITFVERILGGDLSARQQFVERYSDVILRALLQKCRPNCFRRGCPMRFGLTQRNLEQTRCDELKDLYTFSLESLLKALKPLSPAESLDEWVDNQTRPNGLPFRRRFADYMAQIYPITGRARVPDRFQHRWSKTQKQVFQHWLRRRTVPEIAENIKQSEEETAAILDEILSQLSEAGVLGKYEEGARLEAFQEREHRGAESTPFFRRPSDEPNPESNDENTLENVPRSQVEATDGLLVRALQQGIAHALEELDSEQRRLLKLRFNDEWSLKEIAQQSDELGFGEITTQQVGHAIDKAIRKMIPALNSALADIDTVNIQLRNLKRILTELGTEVETTND
jgi:DNA-directed RNA polymerase specialized sigma24 family protein